MHDAPYWEVHAGRAVALDGRPVIARPHGPMGPTITGVANGYDDERPDPVVYVEQPDGTEVECWVWDVEDDPDATPDPADLEPTACDGPAGRPHPTVELASRLVSCPVCR